MSTPDVGSAVTCGICLKETTVQFVTDREGGKAFDLNCLHRNTACPNCGAMAKDDSESILSVKAACRTCNPELFQYDDDE